MSALDTAAGASGEDATASEALDRVVLRYLQRRGYKNAAGVLRTEARVHEHAINAHRARHRQFPFPPGTRELRRRRRSLVARSRARGVA